ncbi:NADPH:quinone oxidoreductase family protein [Phenylobacterium sp.]|jgi:NADPH2:quinone reductase|uniref:NADPH:quinone oxidoreductase family protein n=1 Tax=Phenylobacterium sp. TaxID=1871053 RepID=UPI002F3F81B7
MKALLSKVAGGPETLVVEDIPSPTPGPGEVLVQVKACGVNFPDVLIIEDRYQMKPPRPFSPGAEISGVVKAVGEGVTALRPGDRVLGNASWGGMAEEVVTEPHRLIRMPDAMPFDEAAGFILTYGTSYYALKWRARIRPGDTLLVLGAAGGVGLAAVELGKALGAQVVAACSSQEKLDFCKTYGADEGLVYDRGPLDHDARKDLSERFKAACGPGGPEVIYDAVGGDYAEPALRSIAWGGRYLVIGFAAGDIPRIPLNLPLLKSCDIMGVFWGSWMDRDAKGYAQHVDELLQLYADGRIRPRISARYPLDDAAAAIAHLGERRALGKVVVTMD